MATTAALDINNLRTWVGKTQRRIDLLNPFPAHALSEALNRPDALGEGSELPPGWQWLYFLDNPRADATGADGHPKKGEFLPPAPLPRRMWAAGKMSINRPLRLSVSAIRESTIRSVDLKEGKTGVLVFVIVDHVYFQEGVSCIKEEQNLVYREMPSAPAPLPPGQNAPVDAQWQRTVAVDPVLLFRFSALTYNGHRIHYDRAYATEKEHYPALVVHGPLSAVLLADLCQANAPNRRIAQFEFRAVRPAFDSSDLQLGGSVQGPEVSLWSAQNGQICMNATAHFAS